MLLITAQPIRNLRTPASADMNKRGFLEQASPPPLPNPLPFFPSCLSPTPYPFRRLLRRLLRRGGAFQIELDLEVLAFKERFARVAIFDVG